ncbi:MAG TPA: hypothetical protein VHU86_11195 [Solirubrobacterales bacterium]|jgi:hypothetical protein|nr:hypothetical protein [Solirubrobacterales bacterium]
MIRNLKILGLAVVAVMAMGAVMASAALATPQFTATEYPVEIHGAGGTGSTAEKFTTEAGTVECGASTFTGTQSGASSTLTMHPTYTECVAFGFLSAAVNTEECNYIFHANTKVSTDHYTLSTDVSCPAGQSIKITASTCSAEVKAQTGLTPVNAVNDPESGGKAEDVTVTPAVNGQIAYTVTRDGFLCPFNGTGNKTGGSYTATGPVTVTGKTDPGTANEIGVLISGE